MPSLSTYLRRINQKTVRNHELRYLVDTTSAKPGYCIRNDKELIDFGSNDYFSLRFHPQVIDAARKALVDAGCGAGGSRFVGGNSPYYRQLESALSLYKNMEACCVYGSGSLAAIGAISSLMGAEDLILMDRLCHGSLVQGSKLSGASIRLFKHNDSIDLEKKLKHYRSKYRNCLIITETLFGMDGDWAPLGVFSAIAKNHDAWLMTDDAHGIGFTETKNPADIQMGTLSKALASYGGYVCGSDILITHLRNKSSNLIFSTALPAACLAGANAALELLQKNKKQYTNKIGALQKQWSKHMLTSLDIGPIITFHVGENIRANKLSEDLLTHGIFAPAIRTPTVPKGAARLRISLCTEHTVENVRLLCNTLNSCYNAE